MSGKRLSQYLSELFSAPTIEPAPTGPHGLNRCLPMVILLLGAGIGFGFNQAETDRASATLISMNENDTVDAATEKIETSIASISETSEPAARAKPKAKNQFKPITTIGWTNAKCNNCHQPDRLFSHPVGVAPVSSIPESFPLVRGKIECITCHASEDSGDHADARENHSSLLRGEKVGTDFCTNCHQGSGTVRSDMHALAIGRAHQRWLKDSNPRLKSFNDQKLLLKRDPIDEAQNCQSCHDGVTAGAALHSTSRMSRNEVNGRSAGHPVGISYRSGNSTSRDANALNPAAFIDERIRLFNGNVECGSCHSLFSQRESLLVMSNYGSRLCLSCHDL